MPLPDSDLLDIPIGRLDSLSQDELLRVVVICGDSSQNSHPERAKAAWTALVTGDFDRVRNLVEVFRFPGQASVEVAEADVDQVAQDAWLRLVEKLFPGFRGVSVGEYRAAMRTCVRYECMDHCRAWMQEDMRRAGSLDEQIPSDEGEGRGKFDDAMFKRELDRLAEADAIERECERLAALDAAIAMLDSEDKRRVLAMTRDGRSTDEIAAELGTSAANVYQLRKRGLTLVRKLLDGEGPDSDGQS